MKKITIIVGAGQISALDMPEDITVQVINTDDTSSMVKLANGEYATITNLLPDTEMLSSLYVNSKTPDGIPARPDIVYADQWMGWADFFGWVPEAEANMEDINGSN